MQDCEAVEQNDEEVRVLSRFVVSISFDAATNEVVVISGLGYDGRDVTAKLFKLQ